MALVQASSFTGISSPFTIGTNFNYCTAKYGTASPAPRVGSPLPANQQVSPFQKPIAVSLLGPPVIQMALDSICWKHSETELQAECLLGSSLRKSTCKYMGKAGLWRGGNAVATETLTHPTESTAPGRALQRDLGCDVSMLANHWPRAVSWEGD